MVNPCPRALRQVKLLFSDLQEMPWNKNVVPYFNVSAPGTGRVPPWWQLSSALPTSGTVKLLPQSMSDSQFAGRGCRRELFLRFRISQAMKFPYPPESSIALHTIFPDGVTRFLLAADANADESTVNESIPITRNSLLLADGMNFLLSLSIPSSCHIR